MASVTVTYRDQPIVELDGSGTKTLKTDGKRCDSDIVVTYIVRCPRADPVSSFSMSDFFAMFTPTASAVEVTE
jgi:hypothetical protein